MAPSAYISSIVQLTTSPTVPEHNIMPVDNEGYEARIASGYHFGIYLAAYRTSRAQLQVSELRAGGIAKLL